MANSHYLVLARKWRPQAFEDVVGQGHITRTLQNSIAAGRIGHAFLFVGSRGIGKTTTARILAKALNCLASDGPTPNPCGTCDNCRSIADGNNMDVIEIDGASNNSVEDVREIRENVRMVPSRARYKIYIIDEVHQLSTAAFNALLKTLEEPPAHAIFILATTEAHRIPATIISRCQRYDFRRVGMEPLSGLLRRILDKEGVTCSEDALYAIARAAEGGIRDSESILDQIMSYCGGTITFRDVVDVLGLVEAEILDSLCGALLDKDVAKLLSIIDEIVISGKDLSQFVQAVVRYFRDLLVCKVSGPEALPAMPDEERAALARRAEAFTLTQAIRLVEQFAELSKGFDSQLAQRIALEAMVIRLAKAGVDFSLDTVLDKLIRLGMGGLGRDEAPPEGAPNPKPGAGVTSGHPAPAPSSPPPDSAPHPPERLPALWARLMQQAQQERFGLSVWLSHGKPAIEGDTLILSFSAEQDKAAQIVDRDENRLVITQWICALTPQVQQVRVERALGAELTGTPEPAPPPPGLLRNSTVPSRVSAEAVRLAMEDPHIARVVELFKGQIVEVKAVKSSTAAISEDY